jgi:exonuclease VII small subunit
MVIIRQKKFSSTSDELASVSPGIALAGTGYLGSKLVSKFDKKKIKEAKKHYEEGKEAIKRAEEKLDTEGKKIRKKLERAKSEKTKEARAKELKTLTRKVEEAKQNATGRYRKAVKTIEKAKKNKKIGKGVAIGTAVTGTGLALLGHAMNKENKIQD